MTDTDGLRQQMAYALRDRLLTPTAGPTQWGLHLADAVLPIVTAWAEQQARQRAAEALEAAAYEIANPLDRLAVRRRADALTSEDPASSLGRK